ncbi:MAG TPA: methyltransferase domain-containing protein [Actinospica sp.]|jgi:trans-aconitate 2-methyltransferase|nr:methyltransferase domain-containing protein [Actinospica sp.]
MSTQSTTWNPQHYLRFAAQRAQPFRDLLARVRADDESEPTRVVDLGCGPGNATELLVRCWPGAHVLGIDNSAEMIDAAQARAMPGRLEFRLGDVREVTAEQVGGPVDVLITNATLQWVPGHLDLIPHFAGLLAPGGTFALGVPGNFDSPSHTLFGELQREPRWASRLTGLEVRPNVPEPEVYLRALDAAGLAAEAWETTYLYVVDGEDGVFDFVSSTGLRPVLVELGGPDSPAAIEFCDEYKALLREAYPPTTIAGRTVQLLPFRRIFALGVRG